MKNHLGMRASIKALSSLPPAMAESHPPCSWLLQQYASSSLIRERGQTWENIHTQVSRREARRRAEHGIWYPVNDHSRGVCQTVPLPASCPPQQASHKTRQRCSQGCLLQSCPTAANRNYLPTAIEAHPLQQNPCKNLAC